MTRPVTPGGDPRASGRIVAVVARVRRHGPDRATQSSLAHKTGTRLREAPPRGSSAVAVAGDAPGYTQVSADLPAPLSNSSFAESPRLTAGCLFCGMGGFAAGLVAAGFDVRWANDSNAFACTTFSHQFPGVRVVEKDIRNVHVETDALESVDVLAAGFPCQSFSQAGNRLGFDDPRGALFFEIPRLLGGFQPDRRPALVILENVPNLLVAAHKSWFDQIQRKLRQSGYWFRETSCWRVNVKAATDLPQDRDRLFMVAASRRHFRRNPFSPPAVANGTGRRPLADFVDRSKRGSDDAYLPPENRYHKMIAKAMEAGTSVDNIYQLRRSYVREKKGNLCPTLTANMGRGGHNVPFIRDQWGIRRLSVEEVAQLQGFDSKADLFPDIPTHEKYRLLGNAVCVGLASLLGAECASILRNRLP